MGRPKGSKNKRPAKSKKKSKKKSLHEVKIFIWNMDLFIIDSLHEIVKLPPINYQSTYSCIESDLSTETFEDEDYMILTIQYEVNDQKCIPDTPRVVLEASILSCMYQIGEIIDQDFQFGVVIDSNLVNIPLDYEPEELDWGDLTSMVVALA